MFTKLPIALLNSLKGIKGFHYDDFISVHESNERITSIRFNSEKMSVEEVDKVDKVKEVTSVGQTLNFKLSTLNSPATSIPWCPHAYYLSVRPQFTLDPLLHAGAYYVQEASSMILWEVLNKTVFNKTKLRVLDLCAAPGGKTTLLSSYFKDGLIIANEVIKQRGSILYENVSKWGNENVVITHNNVRDFARLENYFDVMVIDAPCSGSGLFRKDEEAIKEWSEENVSHCSKRQQRIVADAIPALKEDGVLIYSTCSYSKEEDEDLLDWIIDTTSLESIDMDFPADWGIEKTCSDKHKAIGFRCWPYQSKGEGFFIAAFKKKDGFESKFKTAPLNKVEKSKMPLLEEWVNTASNYFFMNKEDIHLIPALFVNDISIIQKNLYVKKAGINCGMFKGNDFVPHHELAISTQLNKNFQHVNYTKDEALAYLRKHDLSTIDGKKGWALACYQNLGLGWMKLLPNRINNYYPVEWRILKQ